MEPSTWVAFLPRDPQWAQVRWSIAPADRSRAESRRGHPAVPPCRRRDRPRGGSSHPHTLQELVVDGHASEWYLPVPLSGRDYRVELGFRKGGSGGWISLGFSATAHVPAADIVSATPLADPFVAFSLQPAGRSAGGIGPRSGTSTATCTSASTRAPRASGGAWGAARRPSMRSTPPPVSTAAAPSGSPAPAPGPPAAAPPAPASAGWPPASVPSGWWPMPN